MYNLVNTVNGHPYTHSRSQELSRPVQKASLCLSDTTASSPWKEPLLFHRKPFFVFLYSFITCVGILPHCTSVLLFIFKIHLLNVFKSSGSLSVYRWFICRGVWTVCVEFPYSLDFADCVVVILFFSLFSANCPWIERLGETQSNLLSLWCLVLPSECTYWLFCCSPAMRHVTSQRSDWKQKPFHCTSWLCRSRIQAGFPGK